MNEREKTRGGRHWDPRAASRPRPGELRALRREGGGPGARSWATAGCQAARASPPARAPPAAQPARPFCGKLSHQNLGGATCRYTWTPASPRGCPHSAQTKPIEAESWAARSSAGRPLKTRALPGLPPLARPGAPAGRSQRPGLRAAVARTRRWGRGRRAGRQVPVRAARRPHSRVRTDEQPGEKAARAGTRASAPWPGRWASARPLPDAGAAGEA